MEKIIIILFCIGVVAILVVLGGDMIAKEHELPGVKKCEKFGFEHATYHTTKQQWLCYSVINDVFDKNTGRYKNQKCYMPLKENKTMSQWCLRWKNLKIIQILFLVFYCYVV